MKLLSTITTIFFGVALATAAEVGAPIKARQACSITMFTQPNFGGEFQTFDGTGCNTVSDPFVNSLLSAAATEGCVCFLFTGNSCDSCEACIDSAGFADMTNVAAVHSFRCEAADSSGCSNSNCVFKK